MTTSTSATACRSDGESPAARAEIRDLHPTYFAFVMATGILSTGVLAVGPSWLSQALLVVASIGFLLLIAALVVWLARCRPQVAAEIQAPERVFGFFAISASCDVLAARFAAAGHPMVTTVLACLAAAVWFVLTYGVPASLLLARQRDSVLGGIDGTWLLWVVATQSLSIDASTLFPVWPSQSELLATAAVALWSVGFILYLLLASLILLRWLTVPITPASLNPSYWILLGATGIIVLAGSDILTLPASQSAVGSIAGFVKGTCIVFWSFGTWFIPLLIVLGLWRHLLRRYPLRYEAALWTVVFPIGMYGVATRSFGSAAGLTFMEPLSRGVVWVAMAVWLLVAAAGLARHARPRAVVKNAGDLASGT